MLQISRYAEDISFEWDRFVESSRNGTFLFCRGYMDYHRDRFSDHSLVFRNEKGTIVALLPANENGETFHSHQGLTYGGFILSPRAHSADVEQMFSLTADYLRRQGFKEWMYKSVPHVYHRVPSEEDEYFLWRMGAEMSVCNLSSVVAVDGAPTLREDTHRRSAVNRLKSRGVRFCVDTPLQSFWPLLTTHLQSKYNAAPVHSLSEMLCLQKHFPRNIVCCTACDAEGTVLGGVVVYDTGRVVHLQYSAVSPEGERLRSQDFLYLSLVQHYSSREDVRFFEFGTSNEQGGRVLNMSLNQYKEGFGARGVAYRQWRIAID